MDAFFRDIHYAMRQMIHRKGGTLAAVLTLALGISANTSMFTLINTTLFKPATAINPSELVWISGGDSRRAVSPLSYPNYLALRSNHTAMSGVLAFEATDVSLGGETPERLRAVVVSGNYFNLLGVRPTLGRDFTADEDSVAGAHPVVVLSHSLWIRRFNANPHITDSVITVNGAQFNVIGVAPANFGGLDFDEPAQLFVPLAMLAKIMPAQAQFLTEARANWLRVIGRIAPGASLERAQAQVNATAKQFNTANTKPENELVFAVQRMQGGLDPSNRREIAPVMALLSLVPLLVLMVACANAANMQIARGFSRRREFAVRRALGASRARVIRQLLTESVLLSLVAGALGVVLSFWLTKGILLVSDAPAFLDVLLTPDPRVLIATTALAMVSGIVFGIAPALSAANPALNASLKDDGGTMVIGQQRHRLRSVLVTGQVTVSLVLVVTAGLFLRSLDKALRVDPGFDVSQTATVSFDLGMQGYAKDARETFERTALQRAQGIPGVTSVAFSSALPLSGRMWGTEVRAEGENSDNGGSGAGYASVSVAYLKTLGIPLLRGRDFSEQDKTGTPLVVIVDETLARKLWPQGNAVGQRLRIDSKDAPLREVIGVARNGRYDSLIESPRGFFYVPMAQYGSFESSLSMVVRTTAAPTALIAPLRALFKDLDPNLPLYKVQTLAQSIGQVADKQRAAAALLAVFGALALILAAFGMYAVTSQGVSLRRREIGIRMSLGARATDVLTLFVREGMRYAVVGVVVGLCVSAAISKLLAGFLFGLAPTDALTFAIGALVLCVVSVLASYVPARRAAALDPLVAMRSD